MNINYDAIISQINTLDEANRFKQQVDLLINSLYKKEKFSEVIDHKLGHTFAKIIKEQLPEKDKLEWLKNLGDLLGNLQVVGLTLAFEPSPKSLKRFTGWLKDAVGPTAVFDLDVYPGTIGGAKLTYQGKYLDLSLSKMWQKSQSAITEVIATVLSS